MRVPEYPTPIRIRWYKVSDDTPELPGSTDYCSSNWDDDRSFDPPLGEQSTTRNPFVDWRDCSPPPWPFCANCPLGAWPVFYLNFNLVGNLVCNCSPLKGIIPLSYDQLCVWLSKPLAFCNLPAVQFRLVFTVGGKPSVSLSRGPTPLATWALNTAYDCYSLPLILPLVAGSSTNCVWPPVVALVPKPL